MSSASPPMSCSTPSTPARPTSSVSHATKYRHLCVLASESESFLWLWHQTCYFKVFQGTEDQISVASVICTQQDWAWLLIYGEFLSVQTHMCRLQSPWTHHLKEQNWSAIFSTSLGLHIFICSIFHTHHVAQPRFSALWISCLLYWSRTELSQAGWCFSLQNLRNYNPNVAYIHLHQLRRPPLSPPHRDSQSSGSGQAKGNEPHKWEHLTTRTVRQKTATVKKNWSVCGRQSMPLHFSTSPVNLRGLCRRTTECPIHSVY